MLILTRTTCLIKIRELYTLGIIDKMEGLIIKTDVHNVVLTVSCSSINYVYYIFDTSKYSTDNDLMLLKFNEQRYD